MPNPLQSSFWASENHRFIFEFQELLFEILDAGAEEAEANATPAIRALADWDAWNQQAVRAARELTEELADTLNDNTRAQTIELLQGWIRSGAPLETLQGQLQPLFGRRRAEVIAATEVTRAYARGNMEYWRTTGVVVGKQWRTAVDERVCPICGPLHMAIVAIDNPFTLSESDIAGSPQMRRITGRAKIGDPTREGRRARTLLRNNGGGEYPMPPAHPRCRCWLQPAVSEALIEARDEALLGDFRALAQAGIVTLTA